MCVAQAVIKTSVFGLLSRKFGNHCSRKLSLKDTICLLDSLLEAECGHSTVPFPEDLQPGEP